MIYAILQNGTLYTSPRKLDVAYFHTSFRRRDKARFLELNQRALAKAKKRAKQVVDLNKDPR